MSHRLSADTNTTGESFLWLFSAIWFGALAFIASVAPVDVGLVCAAVPGMLPLAIAVRTTLTRLRYGGTEFEMTSAVHVGGHLEGALHLPRAAGADDRIRAELKCMRKPRAGVGRGRTVLWRGQTFAGPAKPSEPGRSRFPVRIDIPADSLQTGRDGAFWWLVVSAEHGLPALDVKFDVFVEAATEKT